jgi:hypothetical protein
MHNRHLILTISIVPPGALCDDEYNYEQDLLSLTQAFRLETQTPQMTVFKQDYTSGMVTLFLPGQQELTPLQYRWRSRHTEITGFECRFSEEG